MTSEELRAKKAKIVKNLDIIIEECDKKISEIDHIQNNMGKITSKEDLEKVLNL